MDEEWVIRRSDGEKITVLCNAGPIKDNNGTITGGVIAWRDITERKQMEEEIRNLAKFPLENLFPVLRIAQNGTLLYANPSSRFSLDEWNCDIGQNIPDFLYQFIKKAFDSRKVNKCVEIEYKDRIFSFTIIPVMNTTYANLYGVDITEQKQAENKLKKHQEQLEELVKVRTAELEVSNEQLHQEINERRQAEESLRISENKYRLLLENLPQRVFYKDKNLTYLSCNENFAKDFHMKPDKIYGKTDYDFFPKGLADKQRVDDKRIIESGQREDRDDVYIRDGKELVVHTIKIPIRDEKGTIVGILGSFLDITEKVILQKEAERFKHLASLGELAAGVGHEINNPATGVVNCAQILFNKSQEGSKEKDLARRIMKEGDRIAKIVHSLLSFASPGNKENKSMVSVNEIVSDTLVLTGAQLRKEGIKLKQNIPQRLPEILANPQLIQQVFLNAINNARYALNQKYPDTHENKILEISGEEITVDNRPYIKITFCDHGTGIPDHIKDKVMNPFFTTKPTGKGTGLGLSISYSIVKDHGGKLMIDSIEGEFTKTSIILPTKR